MFALVIIRDNGHVDFMSWPVARNSIYKCIIHTILTTTKLEPVNFVHRNSLFIRQYFRSTAKFIYGLFLKKKQLKLSLYMKWGHVERWTCSSRSFLTSAPDASWVVSLVLRPTYIPGKRSSQPPINRRLGRFRSRPGRFAKNKNPLTLPAFESRIAQPVA
jgi:hypothetical protein